MSRHDQARCLGKAPGHSQASRHSSPSTGIIQKYRRRKGRRVTPSTALPSQSRPSTGRQAPAENAAVSVGYEKPGTQSGDHRVGMEGADRKAG